MERTFVILKPDALEKRVTGEIISRFEKKGINIASLKMDMIEKNVAEVHYEHVRNLPIFTEMIDYMTSAPVIMMILEGDNVINTVRKMIGKTSCYESDPGTIRGDYGFHRYKNLIHASDSPENAEIEIKRFFG
ncbi:MAG: nucleoside-diphosphate kinase [Bacillota bacterium]|nr:nucleoside-diphosphate kinase [Bacillota bacterium]